MVRNGTILYDSGSIKSYNVSSVKRSLPIMERNILRQHKKYIYGKIFRYEKSWQIEKFCTILTDIIGRNIIFQKA